MKSPPRSELRSRGSRPHSRPTLAAIACAVMVTACGPGALGSAPQTLQLSVDPQRVLNRIDEKVYGQFLEHIYHAANGGLWGDIVWNRSFEELPGGGDWVAAGEEIIQRSLGPDQRLIFGDQKWGDYEISLDAKRTEGREGFVVIFRYTGNRDYYRMVFGGSGNSRHVLEKVRAQPPGLRREVLAQHAAGALVNDRWYGIRIRCEGSRIQVWLDGQPIFDVRDEAEGHSRGRVGLASVGTRTRYRQLKISGADGVMLLAGLPPVPELSSQARHWRSYGGGRSITVENDALNGKYSQYLKANGGETGVQQGALSLQAGDPCRGSFWARGNAQGAMVVRVLDGSTALLEKTLPPPDGTWQEYPLELLVSRTVANATLQIGLRGTGEVWIDQVSLMAASSASTGGFRPDLLQAVAALRPPIIRWPGGLYASEYRWQDGIGPQHKRGTFVRPLWDDQDSNNLGTDEFIALCRKVGTEPLLVVSVGPRDRTSPREAYIKDAQAWIEYCNGPADSRWGSVRAANGHREPYRVRHWQIGNETWPMGAEVYAECVRTFSTAMREVDPGIKIIACSGLGYGTDIYETDKKLGRPWDQLLFDRYSEYFDYLDIHKYTKPPAYAEDPDKMEASFRVLADMVARSRHPGIKVFVGEWNLQSTDWRTGLYAGGFLNACERNPVVGMATPALFLRHVSAGSWDNAFINFDQSRWYPAPNYVVMKLWWDHFAPQRVALEGPERPLNAVATLSADARRLFVKVVNPTEHPVTLKLEVKPAFTVRQATVTLVAPGSLEARNTLAKPDNVRPLPGTATCSGQIVSCTLPPLSAGVLTIE